jgi:hypothetical protein
MSSEDGQKVLAHADLLPAMPGVPATYPQVKPEVADFKPVYLPQDLLARETDRWVKIYRDLFM